MDKLVDLVLIPFLTIVGPPLAAFVAVQLTLLVKRAAAKAKIDLNEKTENALRAKIRGAALYGMQKYKVALMKKKAEDGHLSTADSAQVLGAVIKMASRDLGAAGMEALANVTGKGASALEEVIEEEVANLKAAGVGIPK